MCACVCVRAGTCTCMCIHAHEDGRQVGTGHLPQKLKCRGSFTKQNDVSCMPPTFGCSVVLKRSLILLTGVPLAVVFGGTTTILVRAGTKTWPFPLKLKEPFKVSSKFALFSSFFLPVMGGVGAGGLGCGGGELKNMPVS